MSFMKLFVQAECLFYQALKIPLSENALGLFFWILVRVQSVTKNKAIPQNLSANSFHSSSALFTDQYRVHSSTQLTSEQGLQKFHLQKK